jgi:competence protein ComEC
VIVLFSLMAGGGATVWRAATMASIALFARVVGRTYVVERAFLFAFVVMILLNPSILIFDPSFQLSFLATAGLIYLVQPFDQKLRKWIANQPIREMVATMCAAQLMVLPLLLYQMGIFSLTMFPANLIVLPVVPMTMLIGLISILLSYLSYSLAFVVSLPAQLFLWYCLGVVKTFGQMHSVIFQVPAFHLWVLFLAYVFLLFVIIYFSRLQSTR